MTAPDVGVPAGSCDRPEHAGLLPLQHLVEHLRWGCTGQAQQARLLQAAFDEHAHQLAERIRPTSPEPQCCDACVVAHNARIDDADSIEPAATQ